ncbi:MAG: hypothetical protein PHR35_15135, partial [Kiritimatiellae bacterium]|nr:hypothetical protein [Kiritimatiellia bacterium]
MSHLPDSRHLAMAAALVKETHANGGLAPLDLERFWADEAIAGRDPFGAAAPQVALGIRMSFECVFDELGIPEDWNRYYHDNAWRVSLAKPYNDLSERIVGRRLLPETPPPPPDRVWPAPRELHDIFEARNVFHNDSFWLQSSASTVDELRALLDR